MNRKYDMLYVRCGEEFKRKVKAFKERHGFRNLEEAIEFLIDYYEGRVPKIEKY
jgi:hypothetical protein